MASDDGSSSYSAGTSLAGEDVDVEAYPASEASDETPNSVSSEPEPGSPVVMAARAYQLEMLEASLKENVIVAMDTGSGKTQVAIMRIQAELERSPKRIWFIAPTVVLVDQQLERIRQQIPNIISKRLCGQDNVHTWSSQKVWDAFLLNVRLVTSVPAVLHEALMHGFVNISSLSLVIFDEAHNAKGRNPGARLMWEFYRPAKQKGADLPHILGLTASPVISSSEADLKFLEATLDARCRTPTKHREELIAHVNIPEMSIVNYGPPDTAGRISLTRSMSSLQAAYINMDITEDPYVRRLRATKTERARNQLLKVLEKHETYSQQKMKSFCNSSRTIWQQLGPWAADYYIHTVLNNFKSYYFKKDGTAIDDMVDADIRYLGAILATVDSQVPPDTPEDIHTSRRMDRLLHTVDSCEEDITGIIFAQERTTVEIMTRLLQIHPVTRDRFTVASMVGSSDTVSRKHDFLEVHNRKSRARTGDEALRDFRRGKLNLLVATTVLEEGIDVPACNVVICFEKPHTLNSFIQRKGRARMTTSKLILLLDDESTAAAAEWRALELKMKQMYEDEMRQVGLIQEVEEEEHPDYPPLEVESTNGRLARLTIDDAKPHLEHFCATMSTRKFVDFSPYYITRTVGDEDNPFSPSAMLMATVYLPASLPHELRQTESLRAWKSEQNACKDAAFQAYRRLYEAGLINEHLLPLRESDMFKDVNTRPGLTVARERMDPWPMVAQAWDASMPLHRRVLRLSTPDGTRHAEFDLLLPVPIPRLPALTLFWDAVTTLILTMEQPKLYHHNRDSAQNDMETLVTLAYGHRGARYVETSNRHILCVHAQNFILDSQNIGARDLDLASFPNLETDYLVRNGLNDPFIYGGWLESKPAAELVRKLGKGYDELPEDVPYVVLKAWPKKAGYFHTQTVTHFPEPLSKPYPRTCPASHLKVDAIPMIYAQFAMCVPSLMHALETYFVATELLTTRLEQLELTDLELVTTAISAPIARMPTNYERLEFFGDSILKLTVTSNCVAQHLNWPEGLLTLMTAAFVSNSRLAKACVDFGLDRFILTKAPSQDKWKPTYVEDHLGRSAFPEGERMMSTKTLADVVEALIAVAYLSGGLPKARDCLALFMPESKWLTIDQSREELYKAAPPDMPLPPTMEVLEQLIGYSFRRKSLLVEAVTHSSYRVPGAHACLERLEFFGDAILEYLVDRRLFAFTEPKPLVHWQMHLLKTSLVNKDFLAFRVMEWSVAVARNEVNAEDPYNVPITITSGTAELALWSFLRYSSDELAVAQEATAKRHATLRGEIGEAMTSAARYPWALLARLHAGKFYSDVFESLLGAVYVDSGSFEECDRILEAAGVFPYMERMVRDEVHVWHPKEELGQLAVSEKVEYVIQVRMSEEDGKHEFTCQVLVGGRVVVEVEGGISREEVRTRAADEAIKYYKSLGNRWFEGDV